MNNLLSKIKLENDEKTKNSGKVQKFQTKRFRRRNAHNHQKDQIEDEDDEEEKTLTNDLHQKSPSFTHLILRFDDDGDEKSLVEPKPSCSVNNEDLGSCTGEIYPKPRLQRDLKDTLSDPTSLGYFLTYMERRDLRHLVKFWLDAQTFRLAGKSMLERIKVDDERSKTKENCHLISLIEQDAVAIFAKYLSKESSYDIGLTEQLRNEIINKICCENGRLDLDCFITAQDFILNIMQIRYYPDYLRSVLYCKHVLEVLDQRQNLTITDILYDETCLFHFVEFLEKENKLDLVEFWLAAKNFREKIERQQNMELSCQEDAMILYNKYFSLQSARRLEFFDHQARTKLEDEICKLGDSNTVYCDIFELPCKKALNLLEKEYLPRFLQSKLFVKLYDEIAQASRDELELPQAYSSRKKTEKSGSIGCSESSDSSLRIGDWSNFKTNDQRSSQSSSSARLSIDDPDSLWKREKTKLTLGRIDNFGNYVTETEKPNFSPKTKKIDVDKVKDKMKKMMFGDAKEKELLAEQVAALIVQDIQNLTTMMSKDDAHSDQSSM